MIDLYAENLEHLPPVPESELTDAQVLIELKKIKSEMKDQVLVLGHHYQQDDIISFADIQGDSLELAKQAAKATHPYIIFCGVHFMAETADMLTASHQKVILPDMRAGCSMADMANDSSIEKCWERLSAATSEKIIPITYINSSALLKSFVGKNGGSICTSSNARKILDWAFAQGQKVLFFPDQHLGRNTAFAMGIKLEEMVIYNPLQQNGGLTDEQIKKAKVILWYGYCSVHQGFKLEHVKHWKKTDPERIILVHPECSFDVVQASDLNGSTSYIINILKQAKSGTKFAIGTEINLVNRLQQNFPELSVVSLSPYQCLCTTMYRVRPRWLLESFRSIKNKSAVNVIQVPEDIKGWSMKGLDRMLSLS